MTILGLSCPHETALQNPGKFSTLCFAKLELYGGHPSAAYMRGDGSGIRGCESRASVVRTVGGGGVRRAGTLVVVFVSH